MEKALKKYKISTAQTQNMIFVDKAKMKMNKKKGIPLSDVSNCRWLPLFPLAFNFLDISILKSDCLTTKKLHHLCKYLNIHIQLILKSKILFL